jgi:Icc-related predicted phosphoesterase
MKIMAISDIHNRLDYSELAVEELKSADLVLIAGDITHFGNNEEAKQVIENITTHNDHVFAVPGNCDRSGVVEELINGNMNLHGASVVVNDIMLLGMGGCGKTPFHTPQEYSEKDMAKILQRFHRLPAISKYILVTHAPPHRTKLDRVFLGFHAGSKAVRGFIENFQPNLAICGHIHEAWGSDRIGETVIINPGPFPKHYATINFGETLHYELH